jgi:hypothetical protein
LNYNRRSGLGISRTDFPGLFLFLRKIKMENPAAIGSAPGTVIELPTPELPPAPAPASPAAPEIELSEKLPPGDFQKYLPLILAVAAVGMAFYLVTREGSNPSGSTRAVAGPGPAPAPGSASSAGPGPSSVPPARPEERTGHVRLINSP